MSTRKEQDDRKNPPKSPPRKAEAAEEREARETSGADPFADENPAICRGMD